MLGSSKKCPRCEKVFLRSVFGKRSNGKTQAYCPDCRKAYASKAGKDNKWPSRDGAWDTSIPGKGKADGRACPICGVTFYPVIANLKRDLGKFCSTTCSGEHKRRNYKAQTVRVCVVCNQKYEVWTKELSRGGNRGKFCSAKCWHKFISGPNNPNYLGNVETFRGVGWHEIRLVILKRDGHKCTMCGLSAKEAIAKYGKALHVHHLDPYRKTRNNASDNLTTLCCSCHMKAEWEIRHAGRDDD